MRQRQQLYFLSGTAFIATVATITIVITYTVGKSFPQFIPLPSVALITTIFLGRRLACAITFSFLALLVGYGAINSDHLLAITSACTAAIFAYSKQRHDLVFTGIIIGIAQAIGFLIQFILWHPLSGLSDLIKLSEGTGLDLIGGIVLAIIAIGSLPFLENLFGLLTPFHLAELSNSDQPLLRKLEIEAPGTYQHSLAVANLAESGARAIGADAALTKAGALYHDLGKSASPKHFIENQLGEKNPHDELSPEESRAKVLAHVKDGLDMAARYGLPKAIRDFIPMHQGTTLMAYFYNKACLRDGTENVDHVAWRYPGPKPNSKETAIVMLADVAEAVTHSMENPTPEEIDITISKVFDNRQQDGQLSQSTLTEKELQKIKTAFVRVWRTLHHDRLKYPTTTTGKMPMPPHTVTPP